MEKIILSKRVAVALEKAVEDLGGKSVVLKSHASILISEGVNCWKGENYQHLNELSLEQMAIALYVGYEVEETPEEKILIKYNEYYANIEISNDNFEAGICTGVKFCLDALGIEIKGINA